MREGTLGPKELRIITRNDFSGIAHAKRSRWYIIENDASRRDYTSISYGDSWHYDRVDPYKAIVPNTCACKKLSVHVMCQDNCAKCDIAAFANAYAPWMRPIESGFEGKPAVWMQVHF